MVSALVTSHFWSTASRPTTVTYTSNIHPWLPARTSLSLHYDSLLINCPTDLITAPKWISIFTGLMPSTELSNLLINDHKAYHNVTSIMVSYCTFESTAFQPQCASLSWHDLNLQVYLQSHSIITSKYSSKLTPSSPQSVSSSSLYHSLWVYPSTVSKCISKYSQLPPLDPSALQLMNH